MASLFSLLSTARDGIFTSTGAMNVASQNVAGAQSPGYVKRDAIITTNAAGGVTMTGVARSFDRFAYAEVATQRANLGSATSRASALANLESMVSPNGNTISDRASDLMAAMRTLASHPEDLATRSAVIGKAQFLAQGFSDTASSISSFKNELFTQAKDIASDVNQKLAQLGDIEKNIVSTEAVGGDSSDLRDKRDLLAGDIMDKVGGRVVESSSGGITLFGANGVLYEGGKPAKLDVALDTNNHLQITATRNNQQTDITNGVTTGTLGGIREARDVTTPAVEAQLDSLATDIAGAFNAIHATGFGLDGGTGRNLFTAATGAGSFAVDPAIVGHPEKLALSGTASDVPGGNDIAVKLASLGSASIAGKGSIADRFGELANKVGVERQNADAEQSLREGTVATATTLRESVSGVSTDEEMIKLQQFQRGFEASSKVLKVVSDLFDTLMSI